MSFLNEKIIEMKNIVKSFYIGTPNQLDILKNIDITIKDGKIVAEQYNDTRIKKFPSGEKVCL